MNNESRAVGQCHYGILKLIFTVCLILTAFHARAQVTNGGFEAGSFTNWTQTGSFTDCRVTVNILYVHSGTYGAQMGPSGSLSYLSQTLNTTPGQIYVLAFSIRNVSTGSPNEFRAVWNGTNVLDLVNQAAVGWSNYQFQVRAESSSTLLQFGFRNDPSYWAFDDVSVTPVFTPVYQNLNVAGNDFNFSWIAQTGAVYQVQYSTNLASTNWSNLGDPIIATNSPVTVTDTNAIINSSYRFYRLQLQ